MPKLFMRPKEISRNSAVSGEASAAGGQGDAAAHEEIELAAMQGGPNRVLVRTRLANLYGRVGEEHLGSIYGALLSFYRQDTPAGQKSIVDALEFDAAFDCNPRMTTGACDDLAPDVVSELSSMGIHLPGAFAGPARPELPEKEVLLGTYKRKIDIYQLLLTLHEGEQSKRKGYIRKLQDFRSGLHGLVNLDAESKAVLGRKLKTAISQSGDVDAHQQSEADRGKIASRIATLIRDCQEARTSDYLSASLALVAFFEEHEVQNGRACTQVITELGKIARQDSDTLVRKGRLSCARNRGAYTNAKYERRIQLYELLRQFDPGAKNVYEENIIALHKMAIDEHIGIQQKINHYNVLIGLDPSNKTHYEKRRDEQKAILTFELAKMWAVISVIVNTIIVYGGAIAANLLGAYLSEDHRSTWTNVVNYGSATLATCSAALFGFLIYRGTGSSVDEFKKQIAVTALGPSLFPSASASATGTSSALAAGSASAPAGQQLRRTNSTSSV